MLCRRDSTQVLSRKRSSHKGPLSSRSQPPQVQVTNQRHVLHDKHQHLRNPTPFRPRPSSINYPVNLGSLPRCLPLRRRSLYEERESLGHSILGFLDLFGRWGVGGGGPVPWSWGRFIGRVCLWFWCCRFALVRALGFKLVA